MLTGSSDMGLFVTYRLFLSILGPFPGIASSLVYVLFSLILAFV